MPKCDACRAEGATLRCTKCQGCWSCDKACAKRFWRTHKKFCTDDPALKPHVPIELAFERALAKAPTLTEPPPENATCYICLETEGPAGGQVMRGCACRGPSAGFAHVDCLAEMASRNEWIDLGGARSLSRWHGCQTCHSQYVGALEMELVRRWWRRERRNHLSGAKHRALWAMAAQLRRYDEHDAGDWLDEESTRSLGRYNPDEDVHFLHDVVRAHGLLDSGRHQEVIEILTNARLSSARPIVERGLLLRASYATLMTRALVAVGRFQDALPFAVEAVERTKEADGPESPHVLEITQLHAEVLAGLGQVGEAKVSLARVLATRTRVLGANHPHTLVTRHILDRVSA